MAFLFLFFIKKSLFRVGQPEVHLGSDSASNFQVHIKNGLFWLSPKKFEPTRAKLFRVG